MLPLAIDLGIASLSVPVILSKCSGVRDIAQHASMVNVTYTTFSPDAKMRAAVLVEPGLIEIQGRSVPSPASGEVLVHVSSVGVCGSDSHYYRHGRLGNFVVTGPLILGHEAAGTIVAVGEGVAESRVGQRDGATDIVVMDLDESRRQRARDLGATTAVDPATDDVSELRVDAFIDASGAPAAVMGGIQAVRPARLDAMVTGRFPLEKAADALNSDQIPGSAKAVVQVS